MTDLPSICAEFRVEIRGASEEAGPRVCKAAKTLENILAQYGAGHVRSVLTCLLETRQENALLLNAPVILAFSHLLQNHPGWMGHRLLDELDRIDLKQIYEVAKGASTGRSPGVAKSQAIYAYLFARLAPVMGTQIYDPSIRAPRQITAPEVIAPHPEQPQGSLPL